MANLLNRGDAAGLLANAGAAVGAAALANGFVFLSGLAGTGGTPEAGPPGWLIGTVWLCLFALLGAARWLVVRSGHPGAARRARGVVFLIVFCFLYPFYTLGLHSQAIGLAGNVATIGAAGWVVCRVWASSRPAAALVSTVVIWVSFATVLTVHMIERGV